MKIRIVTEYDNIDANWLKWYYANLSSRPELAKVVRDLKQFGKASFESNDPTSPTITGRTTYEVMK